MLMLYKYPVKNYLRKSFIAAWLIILFSGISFLFWQNEWKYNLPTPVPVNYHAIQPGTFIQFNNKIEIKNNKPIFLHFFNPDCPCSRFNITHFKSLVKQYGDKVNFAVVVLNKDTTYTISDIQSKFGLTIPVLFDRSIATICGVYSTPQAVLIDTDHKLYYRGNYNRSRYCTDVNSNYAQQAIDSLLSHRFNIVFNESALKSYGCQLPNCTK
jgi:AhpC/TSA family